MRKYIFYTLSTLFVIASITLLALYSNEEIEENSFDGSDYKNKGAAYIHENIGKITVASVVIVNAFILDLMLISYLDKYPHNTQNKCINRSKSITMIVLGMLIPLVLISSPMSVLTNCKRAQLPCYTFVTPLYAVPLVVTHGIALIFAIYVLTLLIDTIYTCVYFCRYCKCPPKVCFHNDPQPQPDEMV
jgi:hypothetical protein